MYECTTRHIHIAVDPQFLPGQSRPGENYYVWAYTIVIRNEGPETVTLKSRFWKITDAFGRSQEVRGAGVVGETPTLRPGESYEYSSGAPLPTSSGFMQGSYRMVTDTGEAFDVEIPLFPLDADDMAVRLH